MSYKRQEGRYQDRFNYYNSLDLSNEHLDIYNAVVGFYNSRENTHVWEKSLMKIRNMPGLGRAWGYANAILLDIAEAKPISDEVFDLLLDSMLQALPAYVPWTMTAKIQQNQAIIDFLLKYSNKYREIGDPKFYAYDRVINVFADTNIPVTEKNCGYFDGVGPHIKSHICDFLNVKKIVGDTVTELPEFDLVMYNVQSSFNANDPVAEKRVCEHPVPQPPEEEFIPVPAPQPQEPEEEFVPEPEEQPPEEEFIPEPAPQPQEEPEEQVQQEPPVSQLNCEMHQMLINHLWEGGYVEMAMAIIGHMPETRKDFRSFEECTDEIIDHVFTAPVSGLAVNNWLNLPLVDWLFEYSKKRHLGAYRNACYAIAYCSYYVTGENVGNIRYIGSKITNTIRTEWIGNKRHHTYSSFVSC